MSADLPLLVAANRDEFLDRPATEPIVLAYDPWVVGGQDLTAGGTWLGVNQARVVVGVLNRRRPHGSDPRRRSRGLLCLELLQAGGFGPASDLLRRARGEHYNAFNLLLADATGALVATNCDDRITITPLAAGVHLLSNLELNDPTCPRIAKSSQLFAALSLPSSAAALDDVVPALRRILSDHSTALDPRATVIDTLCVHLPSYGTRSSSIIAIGSAGDVHYRHAAGAPCVTDYAPVALPQADP